jgi:hypothetical protein
MFMPLNSSIAKLILFSFAGFILFFSALSQAKENSEGWTSVRAQGMGGAYSSVVDDADSLFINPAGLARVSGVHWTVFDPRVGVNGIETVSDVQKIVGASNSNMANTIDSLYGKRIWGGGGAKTAIAVPYFAVAGFANTEAGILAQNPADTSLNLNYFFDYGVAVGTGFDLIPGVFKLGFSAERINRTGTTLPVGPATLATLSSSALDAELKRRGTGYGLNAGTIMTVPGPVSPSLSVVYKNIGYTAFTAEEGAGAPPRIEPELVVGASVEIHAVIMKITPSIDFSYADRPDIQTGKKIHLGIEFALPLIDLRAGLNQGYYTAGVGLDLGILKLDAATYGVELGEYPGQMEDRRYMAQVTLEFGFDASSLNSFGFGSGKPGEDAPHLKQRR